MGTWCPPCRGEMPHMEEFYKEYKEKEVVLLAVSPTSVELRGGNDAEEAEKRVRDFIESNGYTFPFFWIRMMKHGQFINKAFRPII